MLGRGVYISRDLTLGKGLEMCCGQGLDTLWLCQNSYGTWPFIVDVPIKNGDFRYPQYLGDVQLGHLPTPVNTQV